MVAPKQPTSESVDQILTRLPPIFAQAQQSIANHKKNIVVVRKIQEQCAALTETASNGKNIKLVGEKAFNTVFVDMVNRVLPVKKGVNVADKVIQFIGKFVAYSTEQDAAQNEGADEDDASESISSRFINKLLKHLLSGCEAKDKNVRYRVVQMIVAMINGLGEIDDDLYVNLRSSLLERANDKEASFRVQAALGLAKLGSGEDPDDLEDGDESLEDVLLDMLRYDAAPEVRRAALYNLPLSPTTLPHILSRTRDLDTILRRTVFLGPLSAASLPDPRILSIAQREELVKHGLGDREAGVRRATAGMLGDWLGTEGVEGDLLEFLRRFDVVGSQVAEDALLSLFVTKREIFEALQFDDSYWTELTPEKAFLARVFVDHCKSTNDERRLADALPVVTLLAFKIQEEYNQLDIIQGDAEEDSEPSPAFLDKTFVISELCKLAVNLDYADEIGRRKMFSLAREMISQMALPEDLLPLALGILHQISTSERDLIRVIVDVVTELRAGPMDEEPNAESQLQTPRVDRSRAGTPPRFDLNDPEARMNAALIDMRCLSICSRLLESVNGTMQENSVFQGLIHDLIVPSLKDKDEPALRDQALVCLGLCCMIDAKLARQSFGLFVRQLEEQDDDMKVKVTQVIFDLLMVHETHVLVEDLEQMIQLILHALGQDSPGVQAVAVEGAAKLMLSGKVYDPTLLQELVFLYLQPDTASNPALRQCLSYFFPVYSYSSPVNQRRLQKIFISTFDNLADFSRELEGDEEMLPLAQMGLLLVDWTDPSKVVERDGLELDESVHVDVAVDLIKAISTRSDRETRKILTGLLSKLHLPEDVDELKIKSLMVLVRTLRLRRPLHDAASRNALLRFEDQLLKRFPEQLEGLNEDSLRSVTDLQEVFEFVDAIEIDEDEAGSIKEGSTRGSTPSREPSRRTTGLRARKSVAVSVPGIEEESGEDAETEDGEGGDAASQVDVDDDSVDGMLEDEDEDDDDE